ncbi:hypothetical protein E2C01_029623 [Portunus trituberculatus]|uniref:Uncharacterized protein n=1 Tax=Portunus trituberculatus TaxID=210409 RepID=A0A5B7ERY8_PORTR|nr:hypothetical protein [Portunus trituberculatus]
MELLLNVNESWMHNTASSTLLMSEELALSKPEPVNERKDSVNKLTLMETGTKTSRRFLGASTTSLSSPTFTSTFCPVTCVITGTKAMPLYLLLQLTTLGNSTSATRSSIPPSPADLLRMIFVDTSEMSGLAGDFGESREALLESGHVVEAGTSLGFQWRAALNSCTIGRVVSTVWSDRFPWYFLFLSTVHPENAHEKRN